MQDGALHAAQAFEFVALLAGQLVVQSRKDQSELIILVVDIDCLQAELPYEHAEADKFSPQVYDLILMLSLTLARWGVGVLGWWYMDRLRTPVFALALVLIALVVLIELGSTLVLQSPSGQISPADISRVDDSLDVGEVDQSQIEQSTRPGMAIQYLALIDSIVLFTVGLMGISLVVPERVHGRIQGIATLIFALLLLLLSITLLFAALGMVLFMVSLFLAVPFGTITYLVKYGFFDRGGAGIVLSFLLMLKLGFAVCLVVAHQRFLQNSGLMLLVLTSFLAHVLVSLLHGLVPLVLVSITDGIAAMLGAVFAAIWSVVLLIGSLIAILKAVRVDRSLT
ncbi:hypothetical protein EYB53_011340 [Candidatus Chloroploca sp. M-50]|uniref:Uncharacterized protein n=1 Tax=Candidatus Chloroploca mongolica TaxID=2528176 RepID=A0ABS4DA32_9CHLR|nr:hypothetical protein [Candidatus Chloroploca mongolica]MBP1466300.1 hypothetical protein [Candidatus Chloroploca mongolica]